MAESAAPDENVAQRRIAVEERRIALDEKRAEYDQENQRAARDLDERTKLAERNLREFEIESQTRGITAPQAVAIGAVMTLLGGGIGSALTGYFNRSVEEKRATGIVELEREKFETGLITDALKANNPLRAIPVLQFYAASGLLPNYGTNILSLVKEGGVKFPINLDSEQSEAASFFSQNVITTCLQALAAHQTDTSGFARAVASQYGINLRGSANDIVDQIQGQGWEVLRDGVAAAARARGGDFVIGGIKGEAQSQPSSHGHLVIVVDGPLAAGRYPTAFWGSLSGHPGERSTINWAWTAADRDHVIYAARPLGITASQ